MILAAASTKLCKYLAAKTQKVSNGLFQRSYKDCYSSLRSQTKFVSNPLSQQELDKFWRQLSSTQSQHNEDAEWLHQEEKFVEKTKEQKWTPVTVDKLDGVIQRIKNWKALGLDGGHNYWFKHLRGLRPLLCDIINVVITHPENIPL
eukprot:11640712-Ditylum_brightwellii.AAC.1